MNVEREVNRIIKEALDEIRGNSLWLPIPRRVERIIKKHCVKAAHLFIEHIVEEARDAIHKERK